MTLTVKVTRKVRRKKRSGSLHALRIVIAVTVPGHNAITHRTLYQDATGLMCC